MSLYLWDKESNINLNYSVSTTVIGLTIEYIRRAVIVQVHLRERAGGRPFMVVKFLFSNTTPISWILIRHSHHPQP